MPGAKIASGFRTEAEGGGRATCVERGGATGQPRIATERYFGLGDDADAVTDEYILHYYGDESFPPARADTLTTLGHLRGAAGPAGGRRHRHAILYPTSDGLEQVVLLAEALRNTGFLLAWSRSFRRGRATGEVRAEGIESLVKRSRSSCGLPGKRSRTWTSANVGATPAPTSVPKAPASSPVLAAETEPPTSASSVLARAAAAPLSFSRVSFCVCPRYTFRTFLQAP